MPKRKPKIIKDSKQRGEWAESVFAVRAAENGLPVSKPCLGIRAVLIAWWGVRGSLWGCSEVHDGRDAERERTCLFGEEE
jgi:hypothetical protein